jgi:PAS domain S-box-containing protein
MTQEHELLESAPDAMLIADDRGRIVHVNSQAEALFGYSRAELIGVSVELLVPERFGAGHVAHRQRYMQAPRARSMGSGLELFARRKNGTEFPVDISVSPLADDRRVICSIRDISERKRTEAALIESERRYRSLVRGATYGIYRSTVEGRFLDVNPALVRMLGYESESDLLAVNARDVYVDPRDRDRLVEHYRTLELVPGVETRWKRRDGKIVTVKLSGRVLHEAGEEPSFEMIAEDVTQRRALEERLRTSEKLEAIGRLTAGIAHNFNNLLTVVVGMLDLVRAEVAPGSQAQADLATAQDAVRKATVLIRQMQDFGQQSEGAPVPTDLNGVLNELSPLLHSQVADKVDIVLHLAESLPEVVIDRAHLESIIVALVLNALEAMPAGGTLTIATGVEPAKSKILLTARDTGVGMDSATLSRVFDPFFTTRPVGRGFGLGLSAVYGIVTRSGGAVHANSEVGKGTTLTIEWPVAPVT